MLKVTNKTFKVVKMGKWLVIISVLAGAQTHASPTHTHAHTHEYLTTDPHLLAQIGAYSFTVADDVQKVIEHILQDTSADPLEIFEHLEIIGDQTNNKNIQKLVKFIRTIIVEITKKVRANKENKALNDDQMEVAIKGIILKYATQMGTLKLINPVEKSFASMSKTTKKAKLDELEVRIEKSRFHNKYFGEL